MAVFVEGSRKNVPLFVAIAKSTKDATLFGGILFKINCRFFTGGTSVSS